MKKSIILLMVLCCACSFAGPHSNLEIQEKLREALDFSTGTPFYAEKSANTTQHKQAKGTRYYYNGKLMSELSPTAIGGKKYVRHIIRDYPSHSSWKWYQLEDSIKNNAVLRYDNCFTVYNWDIVDGLINDNNFSHARCDIKEDKCNGIPCHRVSITFENIDEAMKNASVQRFIPNNMECLFRFSKDLIHERISEKYIPYQSVRNGFLPAIQVFIGKDKPFIYKVVLFHQDGSEYISSGFNKVLFSGYDTPDGIYDIPGDAKSIVCDTFDKFAFESMNLTHGLPWWRRYRFLCVCVGIFQPAMQWLATPSHLLVVLSLSCLIAAIAAKAHKKTKKMDNA